MFFRGKEEIMDISFRIWRPDPMQERWKIGVVKGNCRYSVWASTDWHSHQCTRKATEIVEGYGFCKQHAKIIRRDFGNAAES